MTHSPSPQPRVDIIGITSIPSPKGKEKSIASSSRVFAGEAARTCYSRHGLYYPKDYLDPKHRKITDAVIGATRQAGHLTTRQHFFITFGISNVSRQFIWSFLHNHPFYNSEQVSQRYVPVKKNFFYFPSLPSRASSLYQQTSEEQIEAYQKLKKLLIPTAAEEYFYLFPQQKNTPEGTAAVEKKAQEIARYVLGVNTFAYLYHTISALTLIRYYRAIHLNQFSEETKTVVKAMINAVKKIDPNFSKELDKEPFPKEKTTPNQLFSSPINFSQAKKYKENFDRRLKKKSVRLIDYSKNGPATLAAAVRGILGLTARELPLSQAVSLALNPEKNPLLGEVLNLTTLDPISRSLSLISYTFLKKLSHTADSQDQRHRLVPAARPLLTYQYAGEPDFIIPLLIKKNSRALKLYQQTMEKIFTNINKIIKMGVEPEKALYLLPNAFPIRFTETGSLLALHHKYRMRLCYNAQREIWQASLEEVKQIKKVHPQIGRFLLPPCRMRFLSGQTPFCPEGNHFCGHPIWLKKRIEDFPSRLI